jgi:hypothetical protein
VVPRVIAGLRDRALIGVMTFAFARVGAVVAMRVEDYYPKGKRWWEKGGERHDAVARSARLGTTWPARSASARMCGRPATATTSSRLHYAPRPAGLMPGASG